jgi:PPOX class probable F420-dependent enzyme
VSRWRPYDALVSEPNPSRQLRGDAILVDPLVRELLSARLIGVLATLERDGAVHAVPMWLSGEEGEIVLASSSASRKVRNLERDPRATLVLHDSRAGCEVCGVMLRGRVELVRGAQVGALVERVHRRYVAAEGLERPEVRSFLRADDVVLRFHPEVAVTWDERGSDAARILRGTGEALPLEATMPR